MTPLVQHPGDYDLGVELATGRLVRLERYGAYIPQGYVRVLYLHADHMAPYFPVDHNGLRLLRYRFWSLPRVPYQGGARDGR